MLNWMDKRKNNVDREAKQVHGNKVEAQLNDTLENHQIGSSQTTN
jgi:hypothetical protein